MDFSFSSDQQMIGESAESFLADQSTSAAIRQQMETEQGFDAGVWSSITEELGWHLTAIPEAQDGLGLGFVELCILLESMGRHLLCAPFYSNACLGVNAIRLAAKEPIKNKLLTEIAKGNSRVAFGYAASGRRWGCDAVRATYRQDGDDYILDGDYAHVIDGHSANYLVLAARQVDTFGKAGIGLFIVDAHADGIQCDYVPSMDQTRKQASIQCRGVRVSQAAACDANEAGAGPVLAQILSLAAIGMAAEQLGVADRSLEMTVDYISERKQFGRVVGGFQAMKHKAADMMVKIEAARSAVYYAACIADEFMAGSSLGDELHEAASIAKAYCSEAAFFNAGVAMQMHGGVGFTWEYDVHLYFKRAKASQHYFGDSAWHKERLAKKLLGPAL